MSAKAVFRGDFEEAGRVADLLRSAGCTSSFRCAADEGDGYEARVNVGHVNKALLALSDQKEQQLPPAPLRPEPKKTAVAARQQALFG